MLERVLLSTRKMQYEKTFIDGLILLSPRVFLDERGYFFESFHKKALINLGLNGEFVQDNESYSKYGTLRGLHFQAGDLAQEKLVRVVRGRVLDVAVDLRVDSSTFGKHFSVELTEENKKQLLIPKDFAHGFVTLSKEAMLQYKCDNYYNKEAEMGILFSDSELNIDWKLNKDQLIINQRDLNFQTLAEFKRNYLNA